MSAAPPLTTLHVNTERGWRGGERQTLWLAQALRAAGHGAIIAARPGDELARRAASVGLDVRHLAPVAALDPFAVRTLGRLAARTGADVIHAHTATAQTLSVLARNVGRAAMVASKRVDRPLHAGWLSRAKFRRTDAVIAVSQRVRATLMSGGVDPDRVTVIPDGADLSRTMAPAPQERLAALGVRGGRPLVVLVAALVPTKDPVGFVRALAVARAAGADFDALIAGDGPLLAEVRSERSRSGLAACLHLAGWQEETDDLVAAADIVVLSSTGEGQGSVLLDAMQCGRPVAATAAGGVPEVVADGETGLLVPPSDPAALGGAIARLVLDPALRARMGSTARARVGRYSTERMAAATVDVYRAAIARRGSGSRSA